MKLIWSHTAWQEYIEWPYADADIVSKINDLIEDIRRDPTGKGIGRAERLKGRYTGWSSRRVTQAHRLVYRVAGMGDQRSIEIIQCKGHYE